MEHGSDFKNNYSLWETRLHNVQKAYNKGIIKPNELEKYQLFLLETGQFNANFTFEELNRLNYPLSPFAVMHRHTYLRSVDTWAMQVLRNLYRQQEKKNKQLYPIWVGSDLFFDQLHLYANVTTLSDENLGTQISNLKKTIEEPSRPRKKLLVEIDKEKFKLKSNNLDDMKKEVVFKGILKTNNIGDQYHEKLISFFLNPKKDSLDEEVLEVLKKLIPNEIQKANEECKADIKLLEVSSNCREKVWYQKVFKLTKNKTYKLEVNNIKSLVKSLEDFESLSKNNDNRFSNVIIQLKEQIIKNYEQEYKKKVCVKFNEWFQEIVKPVISEVVLYAKESFNDIDAILTTDNKKLTDIIGCLGYGVDPVKVIRSVIKHFPKLFVDGEQTERFYNYFEKTEQMKEKEGFNQIQLGKLKKIVTAQFKEQAGSTKDSLRKSITSSYDEQKFQIYFDYLICFLKNHYLKLDKLHPARIITKNEVINTCEEFIKAYKSNDIATAIRCVQSIAEVMLLVFEEKNPYDSLDSILDNNYVKGAMMTPYAMRAFVRVFQLLKDTIQVDTPLNVYATNQSYYEWLLNLDTLKQNKCNVHLVQHLGSIKQEADVCFVEIHPNNVLASRQFAHDIPSLINRFSQQKRHRTLVIDVTLNALNDSEVSDILDKANEQIESGYLNIILIQSLTKFSQLGLDKRSAGLLVILNNGNQYWENVNRKLEELKINEKIDPSTFHFFSFFSIQMRQQINSYMTFISTNVREMYQQFTKHMQYMEISSSDRFQLTLSSDPKACYIALNINGLPMLTEGVDNIEKIMKYIFYSLIYPLCVFYKLPLTQRVSIGFPLSSISVVSGSIRMTIGLESKAQLEQYAEILAYVCFILNREKENIFYDFNRTKLHAYTHNMILEKGKPDTSSLEKGIYYFLNDSDKFQAIVIYSDKSSQMLDLHNYTNISEFTDNVILKKGKPDTSSLEKGIYYFLNDSNKFQAIKIYSDKSSQMLDLHNYKNISGFLSEMYLSSIFYSSQRLKVIDNIKEYTHYFLLKKGQPTPGLFPKGIYYYLTDDDKLHVIVIYQNGSSEKIDLKPYKGDLSALTQLLLKESHKKTSDTLDVTDEIGEKLHEFIVSNTHLALLYNNFILKKCEPRAKKIYDDFLKYYFEEKVKQFRAMSLGYEEKLRLAFYGDSDSFYRQLAIDSGSVVFSKQMSDGWREYNIRMPVRNQGDLIFTDQRIMQLYRKMCIACFFDDKILQYGYKKNQNTKWVLCDSSVVNFSSIEILALWNVNSLYGPFTLEGQQLYFSMHQRNVTVHYRNETYNEESIIVKQGYMRTFLSDMSIIERELLMRENMYNENRSFNHPGLIHVPTDLTKKIKLNLIKEDAKTYVEIERDLISVSRPGAIVYKRAIADNFYLIELNYWKIKNSLVARVMQLLTLIYLKDRYNHHFSAYNQLYCHYIVNISISSEVDSHFHQALDFILPKENLIGYHLNTLTKTKILVKNEPYPFNSSTTRRWPSGHSGIDNLDDGGLLIEVFNKLKVSHSRHLQQSETIQYCAVTSPRQEGISTLDMTGSFFENSSNIGNGEQRELNY